MAIHELKTDPAVFKAVVVVGDKNFELRKNDRAFEVGDLLLLQETTRTGAEIAAGAPLEYTGRDYVARVEYILVGPIYGLADGWGIMEINGGN